MSCRYHDDRENARAIRGKYLKPVDAAFDATNSKTTNSGLSDLLRPVFGLRRSTRSLSCQFWMPLLTITYPASLECTVHIGDRLRPTEKNPQGSRSPGDADRKRSCCSITSLIFAQLIFRSSLTHRRQPDCAD